MATEKRHDVNSKATRNKTQILCRCLRIALINAREAERRLARRGRPGVVAALLGKAVFTATLATNVMMALFRFARDAFTALRRPQGVKAHPAPAPPPRPVNSSAGAACAIVPRHRVARAFRKYAGWKAMGDTVSRGGGIVGRTGIAIRPPPEVRFLSPALLAAANGAGKAMLAEWSVASDGIIRQLPAITEIGERVLLSLPTAGRPEVGPPRDVLRLLGIVGGDEAAPEEDGNPDVPDVHGEGRR